MAATSKEQVFDKGIRQKWTKRVNSLFAVPIVRNHFAVVELTPRSKCVYTRHPDLCHATSGVLTSQPPEHAKIGMRVKTLSDRQHKNILHVNTASGANWLRFESWSGHFTYTCTCTCTCTLILCALCCIKNMLQYRNSRPGLGSSSSHVLSVLKTCLST